jgi:hypothetical protein
MNTENHPVIRETLIQTLDETKQPEIVHAYIQILSNNQEQKDIKSSVISFCRIFQFRHGIGRNMLLRDTIFWKLCRNYLKKQKILYEGKSRYEYF